jgi:hypothetical protein
MDVHRVQSESPNPQCQITQHDPDCAANGRVCKASDLDICDQRPFQQCATNDASR